MDSDLEAFSCDPTDGSSCAGGCDGDDRGAGDTDGDAKQTKHEDAWRSKSRKHRVDFSGSQHKGYPIPSVFFGSCCSWSCLCAWVATQGGLTSTQMLSGIVFSCYLFFAGFHLIYAVCVERDGLGYVTLLALCNILAKQVVGKGYPT